MNTTELFFSSEQEREERKKTTVEAEVRKLQKDEELIGQKTSMLAILYKTTCLVDRSKSDAVQLYLNYEIELAKIENRTQKAQNLEQELN